MKEIAEEAKLILSNCKENIKQIAVLISAASTKKSGRYIYYKAAYFFAASSVEAMVYIIIKSFCKTNTVTHRKTYEYELIHNFPDKIFKKDDYPVGIYAKKLQPFEWDDRMDFYVMNEIGLAFKVFDRRLYRKLEKIREKRNEIHLQSLQNVESKYKKRDINYAGGVLNKLLDICLKQVAETKGKH